VVGYIASLPIRAFLVDEHIQCLLNWLFRDAQNPALEPFHAVPVHVSGHVNFLFEGSTHGDTTMNIIHRYCKDNWKCLDSFMIFYVKNVGNYHWVLDVAVNPFRMISILTSADIDHHEKSLLYGFLHIDPLDQEKRDGSIPASSDGIPNDSPLHVKEMIFLLNCMSRYRDMHIHGLLADFEPVLTAEYLLALGCAGPFGRIFEGKNVQSAQVFWKSVPKSYFPQLKTYQKSLAMQVDSYNCGLYVILSIQDFVLTQRGKFWTIADVFQAKVKDKYEAWWGSIEKQDPMLLPYCYKIGTGFVRSPSKAEASDYKRLCDYMRMEFVVLMERLHCIYIEALIAVQSTGNLAVIVHPIWNLFGMIH
jgi:hypothetical protein